MVDIHCHILPGFDDGAPDLAEALTMARMGADSGVTEILVTPHFHGEEESLASLPTLYSRFRQLEEAVARERLPLRLHPGAEILCLPETLDLAAKKQLPTLGRTDYVLCEFYFDTPFARMDMLLEGIADCGYKPVVAHPERYGAIQREPGRVEYWFRRGYVIQLNKGSVLRAFGSRVQDTARWILDRGLAHVIASDAHRADRRTTDMSRLRRYLLDRYPESYVQLLLRRNPGRLVQGRDMVRPD